MTAEDIDRSDELREMYAGDERRAKAAQNGHHPDDPGPAAPPPIEASDFFGRDGLKVLYLAQAVMRSVTCGFNDLTKQFYTYQGGVWRPGSGPIEAQIVRLLGDKYRNSHARNALDVIRHQPQTQPIACDPVARFINTPNGMVDWATGDLTPHDPNHQSTVQLRVDYRPGAECPRFDQFLAEVLPADCIEFIWEVIGYTMFSGNPLHTAVLLFGSGRNGKGTLIRVLKRMLGSHNCSAVGLHELTENRFRTATLYGKLANLAGDLDAKWLSNTAAFKAITGDDLIQGENKYGAAFDFTPWALPVYSSNKPFGSSDSSEGWVSRWTVVPFPNAFTNKENRSLDAWLQTEDELRGIVAHGIASLPALMGRGRFLAPQSVRDAKVEFVAGSDPVRAWITEDCRMDLDAWTPRTALYNAYRMHTLSDGSKLLSAREFYNRIAQVGGVIAAKRDGDRGFKGIALDERAASRAAMNGQPSWWNR